MNEQLTTADKAPSRWESGIQADEKFQHPAAHSGLDSESHPTPYPRVLYGRKPMPTAKDPDPPFPTITVGDLDAHRREIATGNWKHNPDHWDTRHIFTDEEKAEYAALDPGAGKSAGAVATAVAVLLALLGLFAPAIVDAQTTVTQTTLSTQLNAPQPGAPATVVQLASCTGIAGPTATQPGTMLFVDQEEMIVQALPSTSPCLPSVLRGYDASPTGTPNTGAFHASGAVVYAGPATGTFGSPFFISDPPIGGCTLANEVYNLRINTRNGKIWQCTNSVWTNVVDTFTWVGPGNCYFNTSGGTFAAQTNVGVTGTTGLGLVATVAATAPSAAVPVLQVATTNAGTATNIFTCIVPFPSRVNASRGVWVVDATFSYGVQQTAVNATQVATEASGLMNGFQVFSQVTLPTPAAGETPSTVATVRWDAGTLVLLPVKASFNNGLTTAGAFATQKFTPANPIAMNSDFTEYLVSLPILCTATSATTLQLAGVLIHYRTVTAL